jgi:hypothetical protein
MNYFFLEKEQNLADLTKKRINICSIKYERAEDILDLIITVKKTPLNHPSNSYTLPINTKNVPFNKKLEINIDHSITDCYCTCLILESPQGKMFKIFYTIID